MQAVPLRLLIVSAAGRPHWPPCVRELLASRTVSLTHIASLREACAPAVLTEADAVMLCDLGNADAVEVEHDLQSLAAGMISNRLTGIVLPSAARGVSLDENAFVRVPQHVSADELWGRVATIRRYRPLLQHLEGQMAVMQRLGKRLNQQFVEVDQELRLASRLQRDFLPKSFPEVKDIRFAALFRPATWVSGDVYDVRRLDELNTSFYVVDAVGHGVAAGLLTMFIRQAVVGKIVTPSGYAIIPPDQVLAGLNDHLAMQELPNCQFVTGCYGIVNNETGEVSFARGGHPHPLHVRANGEVSEVRTVGGLLGIVGDEAFPSISLCLEPGEKLVIYSDGLEDTIIAKRERDGGDVNFNPAFTNLLRQPAEQCLLSLGNMLDHAEGSLQPLDDQTCLVIERLSR